MLKLRFFANNRLGSAETIISGHTAYQITRQLAEAVLQNPAHKGNGAKFKQILKTLELPTWGIIYGKMNQSSAWMLDVLVRQGHAAWIAFDKYEFLPSNATKIVASEIGSTPKSAESLAKIGAKSRAWQSQMTPEQKAERSRKLKEGWAKRKAMIAAGEIVPKKRGPASEEAKRNRWIAQQKAYERRRNDPQARAEYEARHNSAEAVAERERRKRERQIRQGRRPAPGEHIPDWLELPEDKK